MLRNLECKGLIQLFEILFILHDCVNYRQTGETIDR